MEKMKTVVNEHELIRLEQIFKMLSSAVRLKILLRLQKGQCSAGELSEICGLSQSATSHQLKDLKLHNIIKSKKEGMNVFYSLADNHILEILSSGFEHIRGINCNE